MVGPSVMSRHDVSKKIRNWDFGHFVPFVQMIGTGTERYARPWPGWMAFLLFCLFVPLIFQRMMRNFRTNEKSNVEFKVMNERKPAC